MHETFANHAEITDISYMNMVLQKTFFQKSSSITKSTRWRKLKKLIPKLGSKAKVGIKPNMNCDFEQC